MGGRLLLFPGQGSQAIGMGRHLWETYSSARETYVEAEDYLGWDLRGLCLDGPFSDLTRTDRAQVAIFVTSVATWRVLKEHGIEFDVAVGHSLGEYSALVATGQLSFIEGLEVVERRGQAMQACGEREAGTMAAILGLEDEAVDGVCREVMGAWPANYNCPGQVVISGTREGVAEACSLALARGARKALPLPVSGAFHSPLVAGAASDLAEVLSGVAVTSAAGGRFFSTTEVRYPHSGELREVLLRQLTSPVRFTQTLHVLLPEVSEGVEVGPGNVLAGLVRRVDMSFSVHSAADSAAMEKLTGGVTTCQHGLLGLARGET